MFEPKSIQNYQLETEKSFIFKNGLTMSRNQVHTRKLVPQLLTIKILFILINNVGQTCNLVRFVYLILCNCFLQYLPFYYRDLIFLLSPASGRRPWSGDYKIPSICASIHLFLTFVDKPLCLIHL